MSQYWSYENYREMLRDIPKEHLWAAIIQDLRNPLTSIVVNIELLDEDRHNNSIDVNAILETLRELKNISQQFVNVISAVEAHLTDTYQSDSIT